jgi:hypothetical protein
MAIVIGTGFAEQQPADSSLVLPAARYVAGDSSNFALQPAQQKWNVRPSCVDW